MPSSELSTKWKPSYSYRVHSLNLKYQQFISSKWSQFLLGNDSQTSAENRKLNFVKAVEMLNHKNVLISNLFPSLVKFGNICLTGRISDFRFQTAIKSQILHSVLIKQNYVRHCCSGRQCWSYISIPSGIMVVIGQSISDNVSWWGMGIPLDCRPEGRDNNNVTLTRLMAQLR